MEIEALFQLSYGLYVISTKKGEKANGCVVNTVMQVTSNPPRISTTISKDNLTHDLVLETGEYTVSVMGQKVPPIFIGRFGFQSGRDIDKFKDTPHELDSRGIPYLKEGMMSYLSCKVVDHLDVGTHTIFVAELVDGAVFPQEEEDEAMTYAYYRKVKKGTVPKAAPTFRG